MTFTLVQCITIEFGHFLNSNFVFQNQIYKPDCDWLTNNKTSDPFKCRIPIIGADK